jgi:lipoprotein-anchoring transpeptidase ErfK/SrfK
MTRLSALPAACALAALVSACAPAAPFEGVADRLSLGSGLSAETLEMYNAMEDEGRTVPAIDPKYLSPSKVRQEVAYFAPYSAGTIVVDPGAKRLYRVLGDDRAMRYAVAVGAAGYGFSGQARVPYTRKWPNWTPTQNMIKREPEKYKPLAAGLEGGLDNPLGARALYLYRNGRDTLYRIHGTPSPWTVGHDASSGCIRMFNQDVIHLAEQISSGTRVVVLPREDSGKWTSDPDAPAPDAMAGAPDDSLSDGADDAT